MMRFTSFSHLLPRLFLPIAGGLIALSLVRGPALAENTFVVSANDGYGIGECLAPGSSCGRIVADAWCEAHGAGRSISFGLAEDVTGSITPASLRRKPDAFIVTCAK
jgi:hypothetical protein